MKITKYVVMNGDSVVSHKIHKEPGDTFFPALFDTYDEAFDYTSGLHDIRKCHIVINKTKLYEVCRE